MIFLRQSTASQELPLGRFVDSTDGDTEKTALTIANTDIKVWKAGATNLVSKTSGGATHIANGEYYCVLDATDTDTIGSLKVAVHVTGALAVQVFCCVLDEAMYDWLFGTVAPLAPTTAGRTLDVSATGEAGVDWANIGSPTTVVALSGTTVKTATDVETDTQDIQSRLPAALSGGKMDSHVNDIAANAITATSIATDAITAAKIATDAIGASELAADAVTEIQSGLSTLTAAGVRTSVGLASANLDTQLAAIQSDTDDLQTRLPAALTVDGNIRADSLRVGGTLQTAGDIIGDTNDIQSRLPAALVSGRIDASVGDYPGNTPQTGDVYPKVDTEIAAIKTVTDHLGDTLEDDAGTFRFTVNALEQSPSGGGASAADIADAVWEESLSDHSATMGSTAEQLAAAGAAGDPWATALPGVYGAGTAGKIVGDNLDAGVTSRASQASLDAVDTVVDAVLVDTGNIASIKAKTDNLPVNPAAVSNIPTAAAIVAAIEASVLEGTITRIQAERIVLAAVGGKASGLDLFAPVYRNTTDTKDRITAVTDASGNRSSVTLDGS